MSKPIVEIFNHVGNQLRVYYEVKSEEDELMFANVMNKLPVVSYSKRAGCNFVSLYHFKHIVDLLEKKGFDVYVEKGIPAKHARLLKRISTDFREPLGEQLKLWSDVEDRQILPYQKTAIEKSLARLRYIIADDMGIGKTIQALGIILKAFEMGYSRALIVCSVSQKRQWLSEILKFTKLQEKDVLLLGESKNLCDKTDKLNKRSSICKECDNLEKCAEIRDNIKKLRKHQLLKQKDKRIVLANYETIRNSVDQVINGDFDIYVVDEVSKLKNYNSGVTRAFLKLSRRFKSDDIFVPMSGTLIENRVQEFYPVYTMIDDQIFGTWSNFKSRYLITDFWGKPIGVKNEDELMSVTKKFFIRRTVDEVWKDRPELFEINKYCEMSSIQRKIYNDVLTSKVDELKKSVSGKINNAQLAVLINYLIMVADTAEVVKKLGKNKANDYSCKIEYLKEMLIDEFSDRAIIFCKYANKVIPIIKREMDKMKIGSVVITGSVPVKQRQSLLEGFASGKERLLICSDAMSYGMNLQFANVVINFDLPWNPAILDQRIRRLYRRGQKHNVRVFNLIVADSAESLVLEKIYAKRDMFDKYMGRGIKAVNMLNEISLGDIWHE